MIRKIWTKFTCTTVRQEGRRKKKKNKKKMKIAFTFRN